MIAFAAVLAVLFFGGFLLFVKANTAWHNAANRRSLARPDTGEHSSPEDIERVNHLILQTQAHRAYTQALVNGQLPRRRRKATRTEKVGAGLLAYEIVRALRHHR